MRIIYLAAAIVIAFSTSVMAENRMNEVDAEQIYCLALNVYHEARSEPVSGKLAVGYVVLNRVSDKRFPNTICDVVQQGSGKLHHCQFSWWCDGKSDTPKNIKAWNESIQIAEQIYENTTHDLTSGAKWYHADYVSPSWARRLVQTVEIGHHIFYTDPPQLVLTTN